MGLEEIREKRDEIHLMTVCFYQGRKNGHSFSEGCACCIPDERNKQCRGYYQIVIEQKRKGLSEELSWLYSA